LTQLLEMAAEGAQQVGKLDGAAFFLQLPEQGLHLRGRHAGGKTKLLD